MQAQNHVLGNFKKFNGFLAPVLEMCARPPQDAPSRLYALASCAALYRVVVTPRLALQHTQGGLDSREGAVGV